MFIYCYSWRENLKEITKLRLQLLENYINQSSITNHVYPNEPCSDDESYYCSSLVPFLNSQLVTIGSLASYLINSHLY